MNAFQIFYSIISLLLSIGLQAHSAASLEGKTTIGNGGDVIDCGPNEPLLLLDVYEKQLATGNKAEFAQGTFADPNEAYVPKLERVLQEIKKISPRREKIMRKNLVVLSANTSFTQEELEDIPDSQHVIIPKGCKVRQIAIQQNRHLKINEPLWKRLNESNKAALYFHETVYAEAIDLGHKNSIGTRRMVGSFVGSMALSRVFLMTQQGVSGFPMEYPLQSGELLIFPQEFYFSESAAYNAADSYSKKASDPNSPAFYVYGIILKNDRNLISSAPLYVRIKNSAIMSISMNEYDGSTAKTTFSGLPLGIPANLKFISLETGKALLDTPYEMVFDGQSYICTSNKFLTFEKNKFTAYQGFSEAPAVSACSGTINEPYFKVHYTQRLKNMFPIYDFQFQQTELNGTLTPKGIRISLPTKSTDNWNLGFTLKDNLLFQSYQENWDEQVITLEGELGVFDVYQLRTKAQLYYNNGKYSLKYGLFGGASWFTYFWIDTYKARVTAVELDRKGSILRAACDSSPWCDENVKTEGLPFLGQKARFEGMAEFINGITVLKGKLKSQIKAPLTINNETKTVWLMPDYTYTVLPTGAATYDPKQGAWHSAEVQVSVIQNPQFPGAVAEISHDTPYALDYPYKLQINAHMQLINGTLAKSAELPVCNLNESTEAVEIKLQTVPAKSRITLRGRIQQPSEVCYWVNKRN